MRGISHGLGLGLAASDGRSKRESLLVFLAIVFPFLLLLRLLLLYARLCVRACCYEVWMGASAGTRCRCVRVNVCGAVGADCLRIDYETVKRVAFLRPPHLKKPTFRPSATHTPVWTFGPGQVTSG